MSEHEPATGGRRERLRRQTMASLRDAALTEVREAGAVNLSLRSVARRMGMSPAGLYRYVDSREGLLTLLIADAYRDLGGHVCAALEASEAQDVADRLRAVAFAYRSWAVEHPAEFALLFGDPIPGYAAPAGGVTVEAMSAFGFALATPVFEAWEQGRIRRLPPVDAAMASSLEAMSALSEFAPDAPVELRPLLLLLWGRMHGQISLEVFGHHRWAFPDGCEDLFAADVEMMLVDLGLLPPPEDGERSSADAVPTEAARS